MVALSHAPRSNAQLGNAGEILRGGAADANLLMENYLKPFGSGFGAGLNSGWFNSAKPYGKFGFDLRIGVAAALVPESDLFFEASGLTFSTLEYLGGPSSSQTIAGESVSGSTFGQTFTYTDPFTGVTATETLFQFEMPQGIGFPYVPAPVGQLTVGLIKDTDISVRFVPVVDIADVGGINMWGVGLKHGINQWLPGGAGIPVDLAIQFGYTSLTAEASFNVDPVIDNDTENTFAGSVWDGQGIELHTTGLTYNLLFGKNLPFISFYGGIGMESSVMTIKTPGSYPITIPNPDFDPSDANSKPKKISKVDEPINLELPGANSFHAIGGVRLRIAVITISASYTLAQYPVASAGVGLSFR